MEEKKVLLSVQDLVVKFHVRGRTLTAIRGISLDIYEHESIAIVGESGSGKSVFTKTFANMLDENGFVDQGKIIFNDPELADTVVDVGPRERRRIEGIRDRLNESARLENGAATYRAILELESERKRKGSLSEEEEESFDSRLGELKYQRTEAFNLKQTFDPSKEKDKIRETAAVIADYDKQIRALEEEKAATIRRRAQSVKEDAAFQKDFQERLAALRARYEKEIQKDISPETAKRNEIIAKEIYLSVGRYDPFHRSKMIRQLEKALKKAMELGVDLNDDEQRSQVFSGVTFRVKYLDETEQRLHGTCVLDLANIKYSKDLSKIRGSKIATVFQDPMTSLNPIITIGQQITSIILKHQDCTEAEARVRAMELMKKVGIPNAEHRFDDYPFQYSGGMRQRIVIAIALSCQPKILICDEPTTALDVTIQAQILDLIKQLQKKLELTTIYITHDLGVVANVADRIAVMYAGDIVEVGSCREVFYDPKHPYTWALLSSLPQLGIKGQELYSIQGTPPNLFYEVHGDAFAPRNPQALNIDFIERPPFFEVSPTHKARTWLLDPRAPKVEPPEHIRQLRQKGGVGLG